MEQPDPKPGELFRSQALGFLRRRLRLHLGRALDERADDERLVPGRDLPPQAVVRRGARGRVRTDDLCLDRVAALRHDAELGLVQVAVDEHRRGARDRRRGHHEHVGLVAEPLQHRPLLDAETVLLVDHHHTELGERRVAVEQRVRADDDVDVTSGEAGRDPAALGGGRAVGEERDPDRTFGEERAFARDRQPVEQVPRDGGQLLGEHLGRGHQRALVPALHRDQERRDRNDGLARADLTLEQPVHRHRAREVALDHVERRVLVRGELVGQGVEEAGQQLAVDLVLDPAALGLDRALAHDERDLDAQELVEAQPALGLTPVLGRLGLVDLAVGPCPLGQVLELGPEIG
jgi:hypothetical protein